MGSASDNYGGGGGGDMYHVPQQSRREKLRFLQEDVLFHQNPNNYGFCITGAPTHHPQIPFSLSLSSTSSSSAAVHAAPRQQLGPFTGYAEILNRSRFLEPARELLEEICTVGGVVINGSGWSDPTEEMARGGMDGRMVAGEIPQQQQQQQQWKKTKLISMIDEVYRRYKMYYQQVQAVFTSFESVPGLSSAAPYASMALKVMLKNFKCLKSAMSDQLHHIENGTIGKEGEENFGFGPVSRAANVNYGTIRQPHIWRPQRGLPERAVAVLRAWLFEHFLHPYPTDTDKQMLAKQAGLTRNQVSNWFINARVRLWKPMVEEIHSLEIREQNKARTSAMLNPDVIDKQYPQLPSSSTATSSNDLPPMTLKIQRQSSKRSHGDLTQMASFNPFYDGFDVRGNAGVSLTLGLHGNNGICSTEQLPLNVVQQFGIGLEECNDPYVIGSFGGQDHRQFEKEIGGHFLHDFVGEALL